MTHALDAAGSVELAVVERSGFIESRHVGAAVVLGPDGDELARHGDVDALVFPRSAMKPFIAESLFGTGVEFDDEEVVLSSSSHAGTPRHVEVVERMLHGVGLDEGALRCPASYPLDATSARKAVSSRRVYFNCSGKHAGFLAAARTTGASVEDYLDPAHPLQRGVVDTLERLTGERITVSGTDGCGAPVHAVSVRGLARGIGRLVAEGGRLPAAIRAHPWAIEGPGRSDTVVIERLGIVVKTGSEGVYTAVASNGCAVAVKVLDGGTRPLAAIGLGLLARHGALDPTEVAATVDTVTEKVLAAGIRVGAVRSTI